MVMERQGFWGRELQYAAVGVAAAALVEIASSATRGRTRGGARLGWLLLAGGVAAAYAHLVPSAHWGLRSGAAFAQLPLVASLHEHVDAANSLKLAAWGGLTGLALHHLPMPEPGLLGS
jgi:hypothetical protein